MVCRCRNALLAQPSRIWNPVDIRARGFYDWPGANCLALAAAPRTHRRVPDVLRPLVLSSEQLVT